MATRSVPLRSVACAYPSLMLTLRAAARGAPLICQNRPHHMIANAVSLTERAAKRAFADRPEFAQGAVPAVVHVRGPRLHPHHAQGVEGEVQRQACATLEQIGAP